MCIQFNPDTNVSKIDIQDALVKLVETMNVFFKSKRKKIQNW